MSLNDFALSLINNVSFAKKTVLRPTRKDINDIIDLIKDLDLDLTNHKTVLLLLYGPLSNNIKNKDSYQKLYQKLESIQILQMSDEPQRGGRT